MIEVYLPAEHFPVVRVETGTTWSTEPDGTLVVLGTDGPAAVFAPDGWAYARRGA